MDDTTAGMKVVPKLKDDTTVGVKIVSKLKENTTAGNGGSIKAKG